MGELHLTLDHPLFARSGGKGVRVAVVDSGIAFPHPHIGPVASGACVIEGGDGWAMADYHDRNGHGTAVAAAIREKAFHASLIAVRIFDRELTTTADTVARAIRWSAEHDAHLINLSLGTPNEERRPMLEEAVGYAAERGALVVAAAEHEGRRMYPGCLPAAVGVLWDPAINRDELVVHDDPDHLRLSASGLPRPIPGVPPDRNLSGISFAVANATGFLARLVMQGRYTLQGIRERLLSHSEPVSDTLP
ncbi:MAG TPA: S8 family serine peptidase [Gemmatimonadaceae bacterium]|nr:S8 family serine peptidase [Gemmatimonadaceae bacterium]